MKIEKDQTTIPLPVKQSVPPLRHRSRKYPFTDLKVGESFTVEDPNVNVNSVRSAASSFGVRWGARFTCALLEDGAIRVWRTA